MRRVYDSSYDYRTGDDKGDDDFDNITLHATLSKYGLLDVNGKINNHRFVMDCLEVSMAMFSVARINLMEAMEYDMARWSVAHRLGNIEPNSPEAVRYHIAFVDLVKGSSGLTALSDTIQSMGYMYMQCAELSAYQSEGEMPDDKDWREKLARWMKSEGND